MAGYVSAALAFVRAEVCAWEVSSFCDILINDLFQFHCSVHLFGSSKRLFFEMCLVRDTIAKLCPNMIHFDDLEFSKCCSEKVISFF